MPPSVFATTSNNADPYINDSGSEGVHDDLPVEWIGSDLKCLRFGEGYPDQLNACATPPGEPKIPDVPTSFLLTQKKTPSVDLLQSEIKFQVDMAKSALITRWVFTIPFTALTHVSVDDRTVKMAFAINLIIRYVTKGKTKTLTPSEVRP